MNNTELKQLADQYAQEFWGIKEVPFPVTFKKLRDGRYGEYCYWRNGKRKVKKYTPKEIAISNRHGLEKPENRKQLESVLKHELCHWYCQHTGKSFSDGTKDFEAELLKVGATSTGMNIFKETAFERSTAIQKEYAEGRRNMQGSKDFTYVEDGITPDEVEKHYEKAYLVYYKGKLIGRIKKWDWGKYRWNPESPYKDYKRLSWTSRKEAAEALLVAYTEK